MWKTSQLAALFVCGVMLLAGMSAAGDKKDAKDRPEVSGTWARKGAQLEIEFASKDMLRIHPHGAKFPFAVVCNYTINKDGLLKAKITELEAKDEVKAKVKDILPPGLEFRFTWKARADQAVLDDVQGKNTDVLKSHLEGEYEKK
jgi:hypothetical protein